METWTNLLRVRRRVLDAVEADLKEQRLLPLNECLALILLGRTPAGHMRPTDMEKALDVPQYTMSRIIDRLEKLGFVSRQSCPVDGRSHLAVLTGLGRSEIDRIWPVYCASIEKHLGAHLCDAGAQALAGLLARLVPDPV